VVADLPTCNAAVCHEAIWPAVGEQKVCRPSPSLPRSVCKVYDGRTAKEFGEDAWTGLLRNGTIRV